MRRFLDRLYLGAGVAAGVFIVLIAVVILAQVTGRWFDIVVPSTEDFSGFFLAAASFLAMAYTLRTGGHIRVSILLHRVKKYRDLFEHACLICFFLLAVYCAWWNAALVLESYQFKEVTQGYIAVPLWIPQLPVPVGLLILAVALLDEWLLLVRGRSTRYMESEEQHAGQDRSAIEN